MNFAFKRAEDSPGFLLWQLTNQWQRRQRRALAKLGLTHGQFVVLAGVLWFSAIPDKVVTQRMVAEFTKIDKMSMSDLTVTLVDKKLLRRLRQQRDRRAYSLDLTAKGRELVLKAVPVVEGIDAEFFSPQTPELLQLMQSLKHLG
jgi:DNA-binding MarR family transcriptional regulator